MNNLTRNILNVVLLVAGCVLTYSYGVSNANKTTGIKKIKSQLGSKKRYVVYRSDKFGKPETFEELLTAGVNVGVELEKLGGFITEAYSIPIVDNDWKVVEDKIYRLSMSSCNQQLPPEYEPDMSPEKLDWGLLKIKGDEAREINDARTVVVCVTDTGTDKQHEDIKAQLIGGNSYVEGTQDWDDDNGHGTHVAGIIAATKNGIGTRGVGNVRIYTSKVLDSWGTGYSSWIANGIVGCVENGAQVINASWGSSRSEGEDPLIAEAIQYALSKGVVFVAAAGNDGQEVGFPAALNYNNLLAVGATDINNRLASFSSRGPEIDYLAPGVNILSLKNGGGVVQMSGTSMAAPYVSGVVALAISAGKPIGYNKLGIKNEGNGLVDALKSVK